MKNTFVYLVLGLFMTLMVSSITATTIGDHHHDVDRNVRQRRRKAQDSFDCPICGEDQVVTDFEAIPDIPGRPPRTCQDLLAASEAGNISELNCGRLQLFTIPSCGCVSTAVANPTTAPLETFSSVPSLAPIAETPESVTVAPTTSSESISSTPNLVEVALERNFTTWITALEATGLLRVLSNDGGPFTVFAPDDIAFSELPDGLLDSLIEENVETLTDILLYHVVGGAFNSATFSGGILSLPTLSGNADFVTIQYKQNIISNEATITFNFGMAELLWEDSDIVASNGIFHGISGVLIPPAAMEVLGNWTL